MAAVLPFVQEHFADFAAAGTRNAAVLARLAEAQLQKRLQGTAPAWLKAVAELPSARADCSLHQDTVTVTGAPDISCSQLRASLMALHPWRKGPFSLFGTKIISEWRSDWKWRRLAPHLAGLRGRRLLDVGCGNGYYLLRAMGAGAAEAVGADPSQLFFAQFLAFRRYIPLPVYFLPLKSEQLGEAEAFDTVLSLGVLYHRRSPLAHLRELRACLRPGGELALETLTVEGDKNRVLKPPGRYAQMRNVWQLPSLLALESWLQQAGFRQIRPVDVTCTGIREQRRSSWMRFQSLQDFLSPDGHRTLEGHPRPTRTLVLAEVP